MRLLGTIQVHNGEEWVSAGPPKQACVLAVLTMARGKPVTGETLAHRVWGVEVPAASRSVIYGHLARLRALFAGHPEVVLHRATSDGYRLTIPGDAVDLFRARRLALGAATETDAGGAVRAWREAAELWRGPALGGVAGAWASSVRSRLHSEHIELLTSLYDAELAVGNASGIIADLEELVLAEPLTESLTARLMRALWNVGRPADALRRYAVTHAALRDRLGRDPGTELRRLHREILSDDGPPPPAEPAQAAVPVPAQLPADSAAFTGRAEELDTLTASVGAALDTRSPGTVVVSAVDGMAGVGKTALAVRAANAVAHQFPDGQLFLNLHGFTENLPPVGPSDALARLLRGLGLPETEIPDNLDDRASAYRSALADKRVLILLDNAANEEQVRPLLPGGSGCLVLITSRRTMLSLDDVIPVSLNVLTTDDAIDMLLRASGRVGASRDDARRVVELCGRLPLAVRIAAARLRSRPRWTLDDLCDRIGDERYMLSELEVGERSVAAAFAVSYGELDAEHQRVFRLIGLVPGSDFTADAVAALVGRPVRDVEPLLEDLADAHLIELADRSRYRLHDLMRLYARGLLDIEDDPEHDDAPARLYWWYAATVWEAVGTPTARYRMPLPPAVPGVEKTTFESPEDGRSWIAAERVNLLALADAIAGDGPGDILLTLAEALSTYFLDAGDAATAVRIAELGLWAAESGDTPAGEGKMRYLLGQCANISGDQHEAIRHYEAGLTALRTATGTAASSIRAELYTSFAGSAYTLGRLEQCAELCRRGIELYETIPGAGADAAHNLLGLVSDLAGRLPEAVEHLHQVERSQRSTNGRHLHLVVSNLAIVYIRLGDVERSLAYSVEGHRLGESMNIRKFTAAHLVNLSRAELMLDRPDVAREHAEAALAAAIESQAVLQEPFCLITRAMATHREPDRAVDDARAALTRARELDARAEEVEALILLASALVSVGDATDALEPATDAIGLARDREYGVAHAQALTVRARALAELGDPAAHVDATEALALHRASGHRPGEIRALLILSRIAETSDPVSAASLRGDADAVRLACGIPTTLDLLAVSPI
ncbi:BTAD domain-containing putative transcriptional regulator [Stackebrandtia soli]|uniref:AfsR/SARP family transcriptional regulator n=1 Tax=Stackebrandtia soli TaxID=1892856 RepID=UPI0039EBB686